MDSLLFYTYVPLGHALGRVCVYLGGGGGGEEEGGISISFTAFFVAFLKL